MTNYKNLVISSNFGSFLFGVKSLVTFLEYGTNHETDAPFVSGRQVIIIQPAYIFNMQ